MGWIGKVFRRKRVQADAGRNEVAKAAVGPVVLTISDPTGWDVDILDGHSAEGAQKISAVYGAVQYICDFIAPLPVYVFDRKTRERSYGHRLSRVLQIRPNPFQTPSDFKRFMVRSLLLRGNAYAYIHRDQYGHVKELIPLLADYMRVKVIKGKLWYFYTQPETGQLWQLYPLQVIHYKMDSDDGYTGLSVLHYAQRTLHRAAAADRYEEAVYDNNARPGGVLETDADLAGDSNVPDPDNPGQYISIKDNVRRAWERVHGGSDNAFRTAILDNGLKYKPISLTAYDASFVSAKDVSIADIARFFGVPLHALMTGKQSFQSNEQNSLEFAQGRGMALIKAMEEEDSYKLLMDDELASDAWIKRNMDARLRGDTASRANFYRTMHDIGGYSVNDIMQLEDRPDVPGGDVRMARLDSVPLERFEELSLARNMTDKEVER